MFTCSGSEGLITKLSLIFCSIGDDGVQLDLMRRCSWFVVRVMMTSMVHRCLVTDDTDERFLIQTNVRLNEFGVTGEEIVAL